MFPILRFALRVLTVLVLGFSMAAGLAAAVTVPSGSSQSQVVGGLDSPTGFAIAPDGRIFVCEQEGRLRVIKDGSIFSTPFFSVTVSPVGERELLGVAFDPAFASNVESGVAPGLAPIVRHGSRGPVPTCRSRSSVVDDRLWSRRPVVFSTARCLPYEQSRRGACETRNPGFQGTLVTNNSGLVAPKSSARPCEGRVSGQEN